MKIFRTQLILVLLSLIIFIIYFQSLNNSEKNTMSLAVFLFIPYFILGVLLNYFIILILEKINKKHKFLNYLTPLLFPLIFFTIKNQLFTIQFYLIIGLLFGSNIIGFLFMKDE